MNWVALLALLLLGTTLASAGATPLEPTPGWVVLRAKGPPVQIRADRAYLLFRLVRSAGAPPSAPIFWRLPSRDGQAEADLGPNVFDVPFNYLYAINGDERVYLIEADPGDYVALGVHVAGFNYVQKCLCYGTVRFAAKAGEVTDLGHILIGRVDRPSQLPELKGATDIAGFGSFIIVAMGIRPYQQGAFLPPAIPPAAHRPADYRAVGKLPPRLGAFLDRLAPIPGVLAYDEDRVIDLKIEK